MDDKYYLYKDENGNIQRATAGEPVSREAINKKVTAAKNELKLWTGVLAQYDALATPLAEDKPARPTLIGKDNGEGRVTFETVKDGTVQI